ncbi:MAG: GTPase HflX [bacterium]|nr:GTPase HflX [bacterium]
MIKNAASLEKAVLVGVKLSHQDEQSVKTSMEELKDLTRTANGQVVAIVSQSRQSPSSRTYIGQGKLLEIKEICLEHEANTVIFDNELTGSQVKNLTREIDCKVIDRTELIMDIFAAQARTAEAKIQVELAQLKYLLPHLVGKGIELSRLGGGIGTVGPGETQLEYDRRRIYQRISTLNRAIKNVQQSRKQHRLSRRDCPVGAIVGYTNAGKSTLLNALSRASVQVQDKLFTTLDPTTRKIRLDKVREVFLTDTVGFIQNLPHHLVSAFSSTLEEVTEADFLLHVIDIASPYLELQTESVLKVLHELKADTIPRITVLNKTDNMDSLWLCERMLHQFQPAVLTSALHAQGMDKLIDSILRLPMMRMKSVHIDVPINNQELLAWIQQHANILYQEYQDTVISMDLEMLPVAAARLKKLSGV